MTESTPHDGAAEQSRLPYVPPVLTPFGTLTDLTATLGTTAKLDGGFMVGMRRSAP
jgi:hypothetical protein